MVKRQMVSNCCKSSEWAKTYHKVSDLERYTNIHKLVIGNTRLKLSMVRWQKSLVPKTLLTMVKYLIHSQLIILNFYGQNDPWLTEGTEKWTKLCNDELTTCYFQKNYERKSTGMSPRRSKIMWMMTIQSANLVLNHEFSSFKKNDEWKLAYDYEGPTNWGKKKHKGKTRNNCYFKFGIYSNANQKAKHKHLAEGMTVFTDYMAMAKTEEKLEEMLLKDK